jgi:hypothetical protein
MSQQEYVQLDAVHSALKQIVKDKQTIEEVLDLLATATVAIDETKQPEDAPADEQSPEGEGEDLPKVKKQFAILVCDKDNEIQKDLVGWVLQLPEDENVLTVVDSIKKAAYNYNASKKGRKYPVTNIGGAIEAVGSKFLKPYNLTVKTKEPILILRTNNVLPRS